MGHVDYRAWANHVGRLVGKHHPEAVDLLELGCGTGALARELQPLGPGPDGFRYRATDVSEAMLSMARRLSLGLPISFEQVDFRAVPPAPAADVVLLLYDGLNYLLDDDDVRRLLASVAAALRPGGIFVFDQSTPANSQRNEWDFDDEGQTPAFSYVRSSSYDARARLHRTTFRLLLPEGREVEEHHVQRAYTPKELAALIDETPLTRVAAYDGMSLRPMHARSERVHWVVRK